MTDELALCDAFDEDAEEGDAFEFAQCERDEGHSGAHMASLPDGSRAYWTTDGSDVLTGTSPRDPDRCDNCGCLNDDHLTPDLTDPWIREVYEDGHLNTCGECYAE